MSSKGPPDPGAFFREMLGQWESIANEFSTGLMRSGEFARTVHGATNAATQAQSAAREVMSRALAAANMPSREEIQELSARMQAVEERLANMEGLLIKLAGAPAAPDRPRPSRTKKPPEKKAG